MTEAQKKLTLLSSPMGLSGSESLLQCENGPLGKGEPASEAGGVGSSLFTSTSMATRSFRDSEHKRGAA